MVVVVVVVVVVRSRDIDQVAMCTALHGGAAAALVCNLKHKPVELLCVTSTRGEARGLGSRTRLLR